MTCSLTTCHGLINYFVDITNFHTNVRDERDKDLIQISRHSASK